jgi:hypothetical protein
MIGNAPYASVLRARGSTIAQYAGYHELFMNAALTEERRKTTDRVLAPSANYVAREIDSLPSVDLPEHVELVAG